MPHGVTVGILENILEVWVDEEVVQEILEFDGVQVRVNKSSGSLVKISTALLEFVESTERFYNVVRVEVIELCKHDFLKGVEKGFQFEVVIYQLGGQLDRSKAMDSVCNASGLHVDASLLHLLASGLQEHPGVGGVGVRLRLRLLRGGSRGFRVVKGLGYGWARRVVEVFALSAGPYAVFKGADVHFGQLESQGSEKAVLEFEVFAEIVLAEESLG